jgi:hypothetical protein
LRDGWNGAAEGNRPGAPDIADLVAGTFGGMVGDPLEVIAVRLVEAEPAKVRMGLLGYLTIDLPGDLVIDDATLRRSRAGRPYVSFPRNRHGYELVWLRTACAKRDLELQIFEKLGIAPRSHSPTTRTSGQREGAP